MESSGITDLVVQLEEALDLSETEQGVKLVGKVPWGIMKKNLSIQKWLPHLALEEIVMEMVPFWIQIRGVLLGLSTLANVKKLTQAAGEVLAMEDTAKARGFLRVRILITTVNPLCLGCWLRRGSNRDTWVEFRYERLQDFCYRCGRIDHINTECTFEVASTGAAGYGEWTKAPPIREELTPLRTNTMGEGVRRQAGTARDSALPLSPRQGKGPSKHSTRVGLPMNGFDSDIQQRFPKRWRRRGREQGLSNSSPEAVPTEETHTAHEGLNICQVADDEPGFPQGVDRWGLSPSNELLHAGVSRDHPSAASSGMKRGGRLRQWEILHHPLKKARGFEFMSNPSAVLDENWIGQKFPDRCLLIERAVYTEGTTMEGSSDRHWLEVGLEEVGADDQTQDMHSESSTKARGGGGWPSTAAGSP
ncbi:hypothetical protein ACFX1Z_000384 [Malus domestica]